MKFSNMIVATVAAAATMVDAAPHARAAWPSFKSSEIKSWVLNAWGPQEPLSTPGDLVLLDANLRSAAEIKQQKAQGKKVVCYISAGTIENWRDDAKQAMSTVALGNKYKGWGGTEQWVNVLQWETAKPIMSKRISEAASKGCDAIEVDNIDCYDYGSGCVAGASKSELKAKSVEYITWLANTAHSKGMGVAMKNVNGPSDVPSIAKLGDMAIEEANPIPSEWKNFKSFMDQGKLVVSVQYRPVDCSLAKQNGVLMKTQNGGWKNCFP